MRRWPTVVVATALALGLLQPGMGARAQAPAASTAPVRNGVEVLPVRGGVSMLVGRGGNVTVQAGDEGVLLVDSQFADMSDALLEAIRGLTDGPVRYVIDTHLHADHIGGNDNLSRAGRTRAGGNVVGNIGADAAARAAVIAHENVLKRLSAPTGSEPAVPFAMWPTETFFTARKDLLFNGEAVQLIHVPHAHTDGDILVFFRRSDVIATGDVFGTTSYPVVDLANGGHINGVIDALNQIIDLAVPSNVEEGGTMIIPGHGRLCDEWEVVEYRDMVTIVRDRVQAMMARGLSLQQVQAAQPTYEYDARFGTPGAAAGPSAFVDTVYQSLRAAPTSR